MAMTAFCPKVEIEIKAANSQVLSWNLRLSLKASYI
jgi:hypothetical protein